MPETQKAFVGNCSPDKKSYSSPKHCVPPTYPSRELVQQEQIYPSPADQLEEITLKEQRADITALPAPTAPPPLSPPSAQPLTKQFSQLFPPLPKDSESDTDSDSGD